MTEGPIIARVDALSKRFIIRREKSVKERLLGLGRRGTKEDFWALRDLSAEFHLGSTVGLVGHNGSGKSTLLKMIGGILAPTTGTVARRGRLAALLELGAGFHPDLTGRDNVYLNAALLGLSRRETERQFDAIVEFSGIEQFIDTQVKFYSSGMYVRLAFSVAVHVDPDLLLVDEVLAVGDEAFQRKCLDKIAQFQEDGRAILFVSHSSDQVLRLCDRVLVLEHGRVIHDGDTAQGLEILRSGYAREEIEQTDGPDPEDHRPYRIVSAAASIRRVSATLSDVDIEVKIRANDPVPDWGVGITIEDGIGLKVYELNSFALGKPLPPTGGMHTVRFSLPDVGLGSGLYLVTVGVGEQSGRNFDLRSAATSFEIPSGGSGAGLIRVAPELTVLDGR